MNLIAVFFLAEGRIKEWLVKGQKAFVVFGEGRQAWVPQMPDMGHQSPFEAPPCINIWKGRVTRDFQED